MADARFDNPSAQLHRSARIRPSDNRLFGAASASRGLSPRVVSSTYYSPRADLPLADTIIQNSPARPTAADLPAAHISPYGHSPDPAPAELDKMRNEVSGPALLLCACPSVTALIR